VAKADIAFNRRTIDPSNCARTAPLGLPNHVTSLSGRETLEGNHKVLILSSSSSHHQKRSFEGSRLLICPIMLSTPSLMAPSRQSNNTTGHPARPGGRQDKSARARNAFSADRGVMHQGNATRVHRREARREPPTPTSRRPCKYTRVTNPSDCQRLSRR
jgi:hypothetical protein